MKPDRETLYPILARSLLWGLAGMSGAYFVWEAWQLGAGVQEATAQVGQPVPVAAAESGGKPPAAKAKEPWERYAGAATGRIFRLPPDGAAGGPEAAQNALGTEKLALRGILYNPEKPGLSLALVSDAAQGVTEVVGVGGKVGGAVVTEITPGTVSLAWGERVETLSLTAEQNQ